MTYDPNSFDANNGEHADAYAAALKVFGPEVFGGQLGCTERILIALDIAAIHADADDQFTDSMVSAARLMRVRIGGADQLKGYAQCLAAQWRRESRS